MIREKSCGAVILKKEDGVKVLLVQMKNGGHFAFPKGHIEGNETEIETATREILEETSLEVNFIKGFRKSTEYSLKAGVMKEVVYFLATPKKDVFTPQEEEILSIRWMPYETAINEVTYENDKIILRDAVSFFKSLDNPEYL